MWEQPKSQWMDKWINKMWHVHTIKYYSALKNKKSCHMLQHG